MLINWFSPLPPAQSGIAHNYAMQLLPALARRHEVVLWTDQDQVASHVQRIARVAHYDPAAPPWREINNGTISIYHLGNQPDLHSGIWQVSVCQPGIVVLHDLCLHDFFFMLWVHYRKDPGSYLAALERWYGAEGRQAGEAYCKGGIGAASMAQQFPLTREAVRGALGVVTHSGQALTELRETPACPIASLGHPYLAAAEAHYQRWLAARKAAPGPPYRLVAFGYLSRNRRLEAVLAALAGMPERAQFRLDICGQLWDEGNIRAHIERLGLGSLVKLLGFLPENLVEHRLSTADLAINLRYPSMGEASGSQLQFWDYGLPTLVTRTGWYASLPEDTTAFVRPEHEVHDIRSHLRAFLADPGAFRAMGARGRQTLESNDPAKYADALVQFANTVWHRAPVVPALDLAARIGRDLSAWLHPAASAYLLDRASREIASLTDDRRSAASASERQSGLPLA
ncbi:MAG: glycosyltransferase family 4 protein [Bryobacteraceae bacterium]